MKEEIIPQIIPKSDIDLLLEISWKDDNLEGATESFNIFYHRYAGYLHVISLNVCEKHQPYYDIDLAKRVTSNTFFALWESTDKMIDELDKKPDDSDYSLTVKTVLGKMAKAELYSNILHGERMLGKGGLRMNLSKAKKMNLLPVVHPDDEADQPATPHGYSALTSLQKAEICRRALGMLSEREQDILKNMLDFLEKGQQLPEEVGHMLCRRWDILPDNLRQIKCRALKKLRDNKAQLASFTLSQKNQGCNN